MLLNNEKIVQIPKSEKALKPLYVTQPNLPPLEEFVSQLQRIWDSKVLTNGGPFHQELERELCNFLGVKHVSLFANATIGLVTALQALEVRGEVITTPYSFVATAHSLRWNRIDPVFVDIDPYTLNMDPNQIEAAITERTTAILPVHCYGRPCAVQAIDDIAKRHKLNVIYDAAHAFGVEMQSGSVLNSGDLSVLSFHATKVFNTFEGGAIISNDLAMKKRIDQLKNFGFVDEVTVEAAGINGKMNEVQAAFGLLQLKGVSSAIERRKEIDELYRHRLKDIPGILLSPPVKNFKGNYSYFPIFVNSDFPLSRDGLYEKLKLNNIFARRYFYPLISDFPMYRWLASSSAKNLPVATRTANQVLCLPLYPMLQEEDVDRIVNVIEGR